MRGTRADVISETSRIYHIIIIIIIKYHNVVVVRTPAKLTWLHITYQPSTMAAVTTKHRDTTLM